jgi:hypothetical protein
MLRHELKSCVRGSRLSVFVATQDCDDHASRDLDRLAVVAIVGMRNKSGGYYGFQRADA